MFNMITNSFIWKVTMHRKSFKLLTFYADITNNINCWTTMGSCAQGQGQTTVLARGHYFFYCEISGNSPLQADFRLFWWFIYSYSPSSVESQPTVGSRLIPFQLNFKSCDRCCQMVTYACIVMAGSRAATVSIYLLSSVSIQ